MSVESPFGSWKSPLSSKLACDSSISIDQIFTDMMNKDAFFWSELHPHEGGRSIIYSKSPLNISAQPTRWTNDDNHNAKSMVHEYGGGACFAHDGNVYFTNGKDQEVYQQSSATSSPSKVTDCEKCRYADGNYACCTDYFVCVREDHSDSVAKEPENSLVCINKNNGKEWKIASGYNFYSSPRLTADGKKLAWLQWNHPNMPWDETEVWAGDLVFGKGHPTLSNKIKIAAADSINYQEPKWTCDNKLMFINDKTGYWNVYIIDDLNSPEDARNIFPVDKETGKPSWKFGYNSYFPHPTKKDIVAMICEGKPFIYNMLTKEKIDIDVGNWVVQNCLYQPVDGNFLLMQAINPTKPSGLLLYNCKEKKLEVFHSTAEPVISEDYLSQPTHIKFRVKSVDDEDAFAFGRYYKPKNKDFHAPAGTYPPLLVMLHGGPTSCASTALSLKKQYFTSRGFAILDVNYRGSTGYGSKFRNLLRKKWGVYDIEDACAGALYVANVLKEADVNKLVIDGGSAGGYTTLACLTFKSVFAAGASYYGVSDLELLAKETHKFESRYLDSMVGEYPKDKEIYIERSPINFLDQLNVPCAFFQGGLDKIVPENQAVSMFECLKKKKLKCSYVYFPDEGHGFRKSENNQKALNGEFYFYSVVLGFNPADENIEIPIENV